MPWLLNATKNNQDLHKTYPEPRGVLIRALLTDVSNDDEKSNAVDGLDAVG